MLNFLALTAGRRKLWLFAVACCRRVWHLVTDAGCRHMIESAESFADGAVGRETLALAWLDIAPMKENTSRRVAEAARNAVLASFGNVPHAAWIAAQVTREILMKHSPRDAWKTVKAAEQQRETNLLRDLFGPLPFRAVAVEPGWKMPAVVALAGSAHEERRFEDLPILGDALEEAGCTDADILNHCRLPGVHVRGCWLVDALLGKR